MANSVYFLLFSFLTMGLISCSNTPKSTVEKMRDRACNADIQGFFSYVNKTEIEKNIKGDLLSKQDEEIAKETDPALKKNTEVGKTIAEAIMPKIITMLWNGYEDEIKKGKEGGLCKMEIVEEQKEQAKVKLPSGKIQLLQFTKYDNKWLLTRITIQ